MLEDQNTDGLTIIYFSVYGTSYYAYSLSLLFLMAAIIMIIIMLVVLCYVPQ
jgi:hypothetical protein